MTFRERVYSILRIVPVGKVVTYGQLACLAGKPNAARAVGMFMRTNPDAPHTPCHRVVASNGDMHGYSASGGTNTKMEILKLEGVVFCGKRVDLKKSAWNISITQCNKLLLQSLTN